MIFFSMVVYDQNLLLQNRDKIKANAVSVCERLGKYRQAFAWTAIYLMNVINGVTAEKDSDRDSLGSTSTTNSLGKIRTFTNCCLKVFGHHTIF